jgi:formylglycine-generating enzyme required for sulfatase activity
VAYRAFVSSTFKDLRDHRRHVIAGLRRAEFHVDPMEEWPADSEEPKTFSQKRVDGCHLCVVLVAYRRGFVPEGETRSITQMEYDAATKLGIPVLVWMLDPDEKQEEPWPGIFNELSSDPGVRLWRQMLRERHGCEPLRFDATSIDLTGALVRWLAARPGAGHAPPPTWLNRHLTMLAEDLGSVAVPLPHENCRRVVPLDDVFVPLKLRVPGQTADVSELTWVSLLRRKLVALTGDAGCGKSTLLRYIALQMARRLAARGRQSTTDAGSSADRAAADPVQTSGELRIPIFLDIAAAAGDLLKPDSPAPVSRVVEIAPQRWLPVLAARLDLTEGQTKGLLEAGNVLLLLDGLDEVSDPGERELLVASIAKMRRHYGPSSSPNHAIVTCREPAWGNADAYAQFDKFTIAAMDRTKIHEYLTSWCRAVWGDEASAVVQRLEKSLGGSAMADLASNPQMTTLLALVEYDGTLPGQARLFEHFLQKMERTRRSAVPGAARQQLTAIAIAMQQSTRREGDAFNALRLTDAQLLLGERDMRASGEPLTRIQQQQKGSALLDALQVETGLIEVYGSTDRGGTRSLVRFKHRTFQEYLAASHYAEKDLGELLTHVVDPGWSKVLALTGGVLTRIGGDTVRTFLEDVLQTPPADNGQVPEAALVDWAPRVAAASVCLAELASYEIDPEALEPARRAHNLVVPLLDAVPPRLGVSTRARIADGLGSILDPRLTTRRRWVTVPAGSFVRGSMADEAWIQERPSADIKLAEFRIQRWPVTVDEFRRFIEEGDGYRTNSWWQDEDGRRWKDRTGIKAPLDWEKNRSKGNHPVTGVSWWEARAFCRWWQTVDVELPDGWFVQLPTEAQWEKAARGTALPQADDAPADTERRFPWGNAWSDGFANCASAGLGDVAAVGLFPAGHSRPYGLWDMAGNVGERCQDGFAPYASGSTEDPICTDYTYGHVVRGGSFASPPLDLRVTCRFGDARDHQDDRIGFRCVAVARPPHPRSEP